MNTDKIALFGLGKLGLPLAALFAESAKVIGVDVDATKISDLCEGKAPIFEPQLEELLATVRGNFEFKHADEFDIEETDVIVILVNTPSDADGNFSNIYINDVIERVAPHLKNSSHRDFLFILSSTVMPGSCAHFISRIEMLSGRRLDNGFGFAYVPDLVAIGSVINDFRKPDLVILGASSTGYADIARALYERLIQNSAPVVPMSLLEAEISKVSLNAYITMKISFANFIGNIADRLHCDPTSITRALGHDRRISPHYIKSGLPFGGTCFPRDTKAFVALSEKIGLDACHIKAAQLINQNQYDLLVEKLSKHFGKSIGIVGVAFKPDTTVTVESPSVYLRDHLQSRGWTVDVYDRLLTPHLDLQEFVNRHDVIALMHNDKRLLDSIDFTGKTMIDPWNQLKRRSHSIL